MEDKRGGLSGRRSILKFGEARVACCLCGAHYDVEEYIVSVLAAGAAQHGAIQERVDQWDCRRVFLTPLWPALLCAVLVSGPVEAVRLVARMMPAVLHLPISKCVGTEAAMIKDLQQSPPKQDTHRVDFVSPDAGWRGSPELSWYPCRVLTQVQYLVLDIGVNLVTASLCQ